MNTIRQVGNARKRKLRKLGARVWWCEDRWSWVWDITAPRRGSAA